MADENEDGPRENLISTAVKFLQNPKVTQSPPSQKRTFLEKKGLTKEEIDVAFARAGVSDVEAAITTPAQYSQQHGQAVPVGTMPMPVPVPESRWSKFRDYTATIIVMGGLSYGLYYVYKKYLIPLWYGPSSEEKQLKAIETSITDLQKNIQETLSCIKEMQVSAAARHREQDNLTAIGVPRGNEVDRQFVNEVKDEIKSLKGLLLSRKQFPPIPVTQPVLPAWQLVAAKTEEGGSDGVSTTVAVGGVDLQPLGEGLGNSEQREAQEQPTSNGPCADTRTEEVNDSDAPPVMNGHMSNGEPEVSMEQSAIQTKTMSDTPELSSQVTAESDTEAQELATDST